MVSTRTAFYFCDLGMIQAKIHSAYYLPDRTRTMFLVNSLFDIDGAQNQLGTINRCQTRNSG